MPRLTIALMLLAAPLGAQDEPPRLEMLQRQVMERFVESFRQQAGLTAEQDERFRAVVGRSFQERRRLEQEERQLWRGLAAQMRPGVAANADSVARLLDGVLANQQARVEQARAEQRDYAAFLTPIQRAQLTLMWQQLQRQVEQVMQRRPMGGRRPPL
ncbi:MAG TPA: hypothetical protein VD793_01510 [Gemmatimonadales bacterium]|nr:hypothetical protein [Gemmatimonadales bacterium]